VAEETTEGKPTISIDDFAKLDLRVGTVLECEPHPNADRLLKLQVDLGDLGRRQVCAGIRAFEDPQSLLGKQVVIVANLEPRKIRGEESRGMVLAASHAEGEELRDVAVLTPLRELPPGSAVS
jgi:methionyl-tRNA synthetase